MLASKSLVKVLHDVAWLRLYSGWFVASAPLFRSAVVIVQLKVDAQFLVPLDMRRILGLEIPPLGLNELF